MNFQLEGLEDEPSNLLSHREGGVYVANRSKESLEKPNAVDVKLSSMRRLFGLLVGLILAQTCGTAEERVERIDFCEVLKYPRQYGGKEITVRATYFYWFEMSDLYCLSCPDKGKTWASISSTWTVIQKAN